uniref:Uncharacterized protein n=1 Tax=Aegilops tauschii subsp. strangulata TaxID=200361 RepID=A0A453SJR5_AEGTS
MQRRQRKIVGRWRNSCIVRSKMNARKKAHLRTFSCSADMCLLKHDWRASTMPQRDPLTVASGVLLVVERIVYRAH